MDPVAKVWWGSLGLLCPRQCAKPTPLNVCNSSFGDKVKIFTISKKLSDDQNHINLEKLKLK